MSWITSLMMASGWSCAENAQAKAHDDDDDDDVDDEEKENDDDEDQNDDDQIRRAGTVGSQRCN